MTVCEGRSNGWLFLLAVIPLAAMVAIFAIEGSWGQAAVCALFGAVMVDGAWRWASRVSLTSSILRLETFHGSVEVKPARVKAIYRTWFNQTKWYFHDRRPMMFPARSLNELRRFAHELSKLNPYLEVRLGRDTAA